MKFRHRLMPDEHHFISPKSGVSRKNLPINYIILIYTLFLFVCVQTQGEDDNIDREHRNLLSPERLKNPGQRKTQF